MQIKTLIATVIAMGSALGCATVTGFDQMKQTVYATHRIVRNLDANLSGSVETLNATAADLNARVDASDQHARAIRSMLEENQVQLERLERQFNEFATTMYRHLNLSPPTSSRRPAAEPIPAPRDMDRVTIIPPDTPPPKTEQPAPSPRTVTRATTPPPLPEAEPKNPVSAYQQAQKSLINEDYATALRQFDDYLKRFPNTEFCHNAQYWKGECYFRLGQYEAAIAEFEKLRKEYPESVKVPTALHNQAAAHLRLGQMVNAEEILRFLVENYPMAPAAERAKTKLQELEQR